MKFLATDIMTATDKETACSVTIKAPTNELRFALIDLYNVADDENPDVMAIAALLFSKSLISAEIDGASYDGATLRRADITDDETAKKYFSCMTLCANLVFGQDDKTKK